jgi:hypothetical protein
MRAPGTLQVKRENGVTLGRRRSTQDDVVALHCARAHGGKTAYAIAREPKQDAVPTAQSAPVGSQATVRAAAAGRRSLIAAIITAIAECAALT